MKTKAINILESYIKGKDDDQYKILEAIYSDKAELEFEIVSPNISFPTNIKGNKDIARVLSKDFNEKYSKVKTYYLETPEQDHSTIRNQKWFVVMQDKTNQLTRLGTGYYHWDFIEIDNYLKIQKHKIYIDSMLQIQDQQSAELNRIQLELDYPWVEKEAVIKTLENNLNYAVIIDYLQKK